MGINVKILKEKVKNFYRIFISYLIQWDESFKETKAFAGVLLDDIPSWSTIEKSLIKKVTKTRNDLNINNNQLFDEFIYLKNYANAE